jgi:hypothetical protein
MAMEVSGAAFGMSEGTTGISDATNEMSNGANGASDEANGASDGANEAPDEANEAPDATNEAPDEANEAPDATNEAPFMTNEAPDGASEASVVANDIWEMTAEMPETLKNAHFTPFQPVLRNEDLYLTPALILTFLYLNFRLSRWDERRYQMQFGLDVWGIWRLNFLATDETRIERGFF